MLKAAFSNITAQTPDNVAHKGVVVDARVALRQVSQHRLTRNSGVWSLVTFDAAMYQLKPANFPQRQVTAL